MKNFISHHARTGLLFLLFGLIGQSGWGQTTVTLTTGTSWTVPANVYAVKVECWGGGGSGGGAISATSANKAAAGGGAGGAYARRNTIFVTPGGSVSYSIGSGGTYSTSVGSSGPGGDTWFSSNTIALAKGGAGAVSVTGATTFVSGAGAPTTSGSIGDQTYVGGKGGDGLAQSGTGYTASGGGGSSAGSGVVGNAGGNATTSTVGALGSAPIGGYAGAIGVVSGNAGNTPSASNYGGGGSGASAAASISQRAGGAGIKGVIVITYYTSKYGVLYNGNGNTGGSEPLDASSPYSSGTTVTVLGNTGTLVKTNYTFNGWNTAADGSGTAYAAAATFSISANTTLYAQWASAPTLTTPTATSIATTSATLGATVTADGGATLSARGTVWGTAAAPTANSLAEGNTTVSAFSHSRSSLTANTLYYYRGYATNSVGTSYSADGTFTTLPLAPTVGSGSSASTSGFTANWTAPTMGSVAYTYTVEVDNDNTFGSIDATVSSIASSSTSQAITGLSASTTYYYRVKTVNTQGSSAWSSTSTGIATSAASSPTLTAVTLGSALSSTYGTASTGVSFAVGGSNLSTTITATPQSGYEISLTLNGTYQSTAMTSLANGSSLYVRFASTKAASSYNGVTVVVLSGGGAASDAYVTTAASSNIVSPKALTITGATATNRAYNGGTTVAVSGGSLSGVLIADNANVTLGGSPSGTVVTAAVGNSKAVTVTSYNISGSASANYSLTQPTDVTVNITQASLTITASDVSKVAGVALTGGAGSTAFTSSGLQNAETIGTVTVAYGTAGDATGDGNIAGVYASQVTPSAATAGSFTSSNYSISYVAGSITVLSAPVTLAAWDFNGYSGGGSSPQSPTTTNSNLTIVGLTRASGLTVSSAAANAWGTNGPQTSPTNAATAITANSFITFSVKSNSGAVVSLNGIAGYNVRRSSTGYTSGQWQYSTDGTNFSNIGSAITWGSTTSAPYNSQVAIDLSSISAIQNLTSSTTVTFRIALWGATGTSGSWYLNEFQTGNDFIVSGYVITAPILSTPTSASIATTSATLGATISSDGGASVTERGTVWGTAAAPTGNSLAASGTAVEAFSHSRTGLTANTLYYYRGFATNSIGTGYSADGTFTSLPLAPTVGSGSSATTSGFTASWSHPTMGSASYTYTVEVDNDNTFGSIDATVSSIASSSTSTAITGLSAGTIYYYRVKSVNTGSSSWSSTSAGYATLSTDATLSALSLSSGTLNPVFASATIAYTASVTNATTSITLTPTRNQANATIQVRVNGGSYTAVTSGNASGSLSLNVNDNTVDVLVTAQDGSSVKTYTITVTRAATTPSAPTITSITPGNQQLSVVFTAGATGGSAITNYKYSTDGGATFTAINPAATTSPITITGLVNGTSYNVQIKAVNAVGDGTATGSTAATPVTTPGAPTITSITPGNGQLSVAFTAGATGGSVLTNYKYSTDGGSTFVAVSPAATSSPITITGLVNGTSYNVQIKAVNAVGDGAATGSTAATPVTTPNAPSIGTAVLGDGQATVTFTAPTFSGGTAITSFTVTSSPGSITATGSGSPITVTGLSNGTAYTFTVSATNVVGTGPESAASNEVTPSTIAVPVINSSLTASATYGVVATTYTITATNSPTSFSATGLPAGLILNTSSGEITGTPTVAPGNYNVTITATNAGGTGLPATLVYSITAKTLTLPDAAATSKVYNRTNAAVVTGTLTGVVGSDDVSLVGTGTFSQIGIGTGLTVTSTASLTGAKASYYTLTPPSGLTANITAKSLTVTGATAVNRAYTGLAAATITVVSLQGVISPDAVTVIGGGTFASVSVANTISVTASLSLNGVDSGNYSLTQPVGLTANITPATLTITNVTGVNRAYDGSTTATVTGTPAYSGLQNGETFTVSGTPTFNFVTATAGNGISITIGNSGYTAPSGNYTLTQPTLTANITKVPLTITAADQSVAYATPVATVTGAGSYTPTGFVNSETASVIGGSATYSTTYTTTTAVGTSGVTISPIVTGLSATNYSFTAANGTVTVSIASQTITALTTPITKILSDATYSVATTATSGLTVTYASNNSSVATVAANGTVTIQGVGTATITASQAGNGNYNPATSVTQALTVNPNPVITATPAALAAFTSTSGTASTYQAFTVSGSNLIANITVTAPTGFEVSQTAGGAGVYAATQTLIQASGSVSKVVYVRMTASATSTPSGNVALTSTSASTINVAVSGMVNAQCSTAVTIFSENMGSPSGTTAIRSNTFQNSSPITFSGTGDVRNTTASSGYSGASAGGNVLISNTNFVISGINTTGYTSLALSLGHYKSTTASNNELVVEVSSDGTSYSALTYSRATGSGTASWLLVSPTGTIPATSNLRIRFSNTTTSPQFRIDDVVLTGIPTCVPSISSGGGPLTSLSTTYGTPSSPSSFTLSGSNLSSTISIAALSGFEFSATAGGAGAYTSTLNGISATGSTIIYVRLAASANVGTYSGNIVCSSGSTSLNVPMASSTVSKATPTLSVSNTPTTYNGSTQAATATASGGGTVSNILTGGAATQTNAGTYTVTADIAASSNYNSASGVTASNSFVINKASSSVTVTGSTSLIYSGSAQGPSFTVTGSSGAVSYNYSGVSPTVYATSPTAPTNVGSYTVTASVAADANYLAASSSATAFGIVYPTNDWTGAISTSWNNAGNWSLSRVPLSTDNITISSGSPILDISHTINAGRTLTISGSGTLTLNPNAILTIAGTADFGGKSVTLKSDATGTAAIGQVTGTLSNATNVTVERYIPAKRAWRALTAPLKGNNTTLFASWQNGGVAVDPFNTGVELWGPSGTGLATGPGYNIRQYTTSGWADVTNTQSANLFATDSNKAYLVFVTGGYGSNNIGNGQSAATTLKATGQLITGPVSFAVTSTRHTLVGNPFASPLSPSAILAGNPQANLFTNIWMWDPAISSFGAYVNYDASINSGEFSDTSGNYSSSLAAIQSGQAFFVRAQSGTDTLTLTESMKSSSISNTFRNSNSIAASVFRLGFAKQIGTEWMPLDGCIAAFYDAANPAVDVADGTKMVNTYENIAFVRGTTNLSIEHYPLVNATDQLNVKIWNAQQAHYKLKLNTEEFTMAGVEAYLQDLYTGTSQPLNLDGSVQDYEFDVDPTVSASSGNRFRIVFTNTALAVTHPEQGQLSIYPNPATGGKVTVSLPNGTFEGCSYELINVLGQVVRQDEISNANAAQVSIPITGLPNSWYALRILKDNSVLFQGKLIIKN